MPKVELKQVRVNEIKEKINGATSIILVDHRGLTVEEDTALRKELREAKVTYKVYKNTMMNLAFEGTVFAALSKDLEGPSAIAVCYEDPTVAARILDKATAKYKALEFKAGVVEGTYYDVDGIKAVAKIPSREELLSKLLGSLKSPVSAFARTIKALSEKMEETGAANASAIVAEKAVEAVVEEAVAAE